MRDDPSLWVEAEVDWILVFHFLQARSQITLLGHLIHRREVIHLLEGLELAELFRWNRHVVPDDIDVRMAIHLVLLRLVHRRMLVLMLAARVFFLLSLRIWNHWRLRISALFGRNDLPLHLEGALADHLVLCIRQVNSYLTTVENVVVASTHDWAHQILLSSRRRNGFTRSCVLVRICRRRSGVRN